MSTTLITGGSGQVGRCMREEALLEAHIITPRRIDFNLNDPASLNAKLAEIQPSAIVNCAAYTNVDGAESDSEMAYRVNAESPKVMAQYAAEKQIPFIQVSTDFVFDGSQSRPYRPNDSVNPINVYGASKLAGERQVLASNPHAYILRTSWVYSEYGNNFVLKMLELAKNRDSLAVVADQVGSPCYARSLARVVWKLLKIQPKERLFHYANEGSISRHELIVAAIDEGHAAGLIGKVIPIEKALTKDFPSPATRPAYSTLDSSLICNTLAITPVHWRDALREMVAQVLAQNHSDFG